MSDQAQSDQAQSDTQAEVSSTAAAAGAVIDEAESLPAAADHAPASDGTGNDRAPGFARQFVLGLLGILLLIELVLAGVPRPDTDTPRSADELRDLLLALGTADQPSYLLIGDSVLVGDTGKDQLPDWQTRRLVDYLRRESAGEVGFHQAAYSGLLPIDMLAIVDSLDALDPDGSVSLVIELSPRHFSPSYAQQAEHSRPWFAELGGGLGGRFSPATLSARALAWARHYAPIYRHRELFAAGRRGLAVPGELAADPDRGDPENLEGESGDRVEAFARLSVHYRDSNVQPDSLQAQAIAEIAARCRASGRTVAFMATPVEDGFLNGLVDERGQGDYLAGLARLIQPDGRQVSLLPMDHPLFASALFWDHVHLRPEGHRLLALNLLVQLGIPLERLPPPQELITLDEIDESLVARIDLGFVDGAAWQAKFATPQALAVSADGLRVVIADTDNHVLRELRGDMRVVTTIAGSPGEAGQLDGPGPQARLDRPYRAVFIGEQLWFADQHGKALRRLDPDGGVTTVQPASPWRTQAMRAHADQLYLLQRNGRSTRISRVDPQQPRAQPVTIASGGGRREGQIEAFDLDPAGNLYLATRTGALLRIAAAAERSDAVDLGKDIAAAAERSDAAEVLVLFDNLASEDKPRSVMPQGKNEFFPFSFDRIKLSQVTDLVWVERYGGLLVQDLTPQHKRGKYQNPVTERAMLRFFDLERQQIYPWLKPLVAGIGYFHKNSETESFASYYHEGAMALHQGSATLFYLESGRSRLLRLGDGLLGVAEIGDVNYSKLGFADVLTSRAGERATKDLRPQDHLAAADPYQTRAGPYTWLIVGSSMLAMSDSVGQYSLGRLLDQRLRYQLAVRDRVALQTFQRTIPGAAVERQVSAVKSFIKHGGRPDVILIESNASTFLKEDADRAFMAKQLDALVKQAGAWDSLLLILDTSPYIARNRDGLRPTPAPVLEFLDMARARGIPVIDVGDLMLDAHLQVTPISSPPMTGIHMSTWSIDALADLAAAAIAPVMRAALRDRPPALFAEARADKGKRKRKPLAGAFDAVEIDWEATLPKVPLAAMQTIYEDEHLQIFVDLGLVPEGVIDESNLDGVILACIYEHAVHQRNGALSAEVAIGRFSKYDEYGAGVAEGAEILRRDQLQLEELQALVQRVTGK